MRTRTIVLVGLMIALVLGGIVSYYASTHPDGLEHVAEQVGVGDTADKSATGSPLADYEVDGVDDPRLSGGLAGVIGILVTLAIAGGLMLAVRRRDRDSD